ncbi:hypothetical protein IQ07DRAFT_169977 [Pyrenochaeta sp. DS3sAY3a]|nr:hypothetical protein IQ07DRAFT_169977 [Pyrenochaeta sp. DS3sAY3a]
MSCSKEQPNPSAASKDMVLRLLFCIACFVIQDLSDALPMVFKAGIALGPEIAVFLAFQRKWASILIVLGVMAYAKLQKYGLQAPALLPDASKPTDTTCEAGSTNASTAMTKSKTFNVLDGHNHQEISTKVSTKSKTSDALDGHQNQETSTEVSTTSKTSDALDGHQNQEISTEVSTKSKTSNALDGHQNQEISTEVSTMSKASNASDGHKNQETSVKASVMSKTSNGLNGHNNQGAYRNNNRRQNNGPIRNRCGNKERLNTPQPRQPERPTPQGWANHYNVIMAKDAEHYKEVRAKAKEMEGQRTTINQTYMHIRQVNGTRVKEVTKETFE